MIVTQITRFPGRVAGGAAKASTLAFDHVCVRGKARSGRRCIERDTKSKKSCREDARPFTTNGAREDMGRRNAVTCSAVCRLRLLHWAFLHGVALLPLGIYSRPNILSTLSLCWECLRAMSRIRSSQSATSCVSPVFFTAFTSAVELLQACF